jgi:hypothetical protein
MIVHVTLLARTIVTNFAVKNAACFGLKRVAKHCYIKQPEKKCPVFDAFFEKVIVTTFFWKI